MMEIKFLSITYSLHYEKFNDGSEKCIEDEIPFELPEGWSWSRLKSIAIIQSSCCWQNIIDRISHS